MTHIEWQFGGWLRALPTSYAAALLVVLAAAGFFYVFWFYRRTDGELPDRTRRLLAGLRATLVLLLLLCLANPMRIHEWAPSQKPARTLTVLVDRSESMSAPDFRGNTRLMAALRLWRQVEPSARKSFTTIEYERFANDRQSAGSLEEAANAGKAGSETHLFAALRDTLAKDPAAIVCLSDGLDTSSDDAGKFATEAAQRSIPIYFVPGENRLLPGMSLTLREVKAPSRVLRQTQFTATALIETAAAKDEDLPAELWMNGKKISAAKLPVRAGRNTLSWAVTVDSGEPRTLALEFRVGDQAASCAADVVENTTMDVLYYQGALQWGYRFLRGALESDPSFRLTAILNPALQVRLTTAPLNGSALNDLPEDVVDLRRFQIVILAHVFADQLTPKQQQALVDYVRGGGGVLFISPDTEATKRFSGTALEQMLPVVFTSADDASNHGLQRMRLQLNANAAQYGGDLSAGGSQSIPLKSFALPAGARHGAASRLFENTNADTLPKFSENAKVRALKPGAETLAVSSENASDVLLARQQFGNGFAAALTTDLLWRWKLSLPSTSHAVEKFWQQLLLSLAPASGHGLSLVKLTAVPAVNAPVAFSLETAASGQIPTLESISPRGERQRLIVTEGRDNNPAMASFTPNSTGRWEVQAVDTTGHSVHVVFPVAEKASSAELLNLPADVAGMKQLAESTGGALVDNTTTFPSPAEANVKLPSKPPEPLWNSSALMFVMLGLYSTELIVRRRSKLL